MTTISQPLQCDLQPQVPKHPTTTQTRRNTHCKTPSRNQSHTKTNGPRPRHTWAALHRWLQPLYTEKHTVSCSSFLPNTTPIQHPCSHYNAFCNITWLTRMYLRTWKQTMATIYSHYTAICSQRFNKRIELRTHEQPHVAEHQGRTKKHQKRSQPHTEKYKVSCSGFLPNTSPMQHSCSTLGQMYCCAMYCYVMYCYVMYCYVMLSDQ